VSHFGDEPGGELRELFFETAQELLQSLNDGALQLEGHPGDLEIVRGIRRTVHTLKGDAAACGFRELSELAHEFEDALAIEAETAGRVRLAEVAFQAADIFAAMLAAYQRGLPLPDSESLRSAIRQLTDHPQGKPSEPKAAVEPRGRAAWAEYENLAAEEALRAGKKVYHLIARLDPLCAMPIAARQLLVNAAGTLGEILASRPDARSAPGSLPCELLLATEGGPEKVAAKCRIPTVISELVISELTAEAIDAQQPRARQPVATKPAPSRAEPAAPSRPAQGRAEIRTEIRTAEPVETQAAALGAENVLRVDAERIDNVLNLVGELIIGKSMLLQAVSDFSKRYPKEPIRGRLADAIAFQSRVLGELQRSVMKVRMVPVEQLFRRFPRMVRDVGRSCGKNVVLAVSGENTDLDKSLLDAIAEPLTHIVRNAIGHGIESEAERVRAGKPAHGTIRLNAYHQGNQLIVEVADDGSGIHVEKVKKRALRQGLLSEEEAGRLSEAEVIELVFRPGFSTAEEVTEISGRGVGLDVVRSVLHRLKGTVDIQMKAGEGTTFRLKLPLTLAIIKALLFRVEQQLYAIPLNAVAEIARARQSEVHQVSHYEVLQLRDEVLPLIRMGHSSEHAGLGEGGAEERTEQAGAEQERADQERAEQGGAGGTGAKIFVLVIAFGGRKIGLVVDGMEGEEELVIKTLDDHAVVTDLVSGASILGDGRVVLIVNVAAIVERFLKSGRQREPKPVSGLLLPSTARLSPAAEVRP
jgi:two-component system chemotaxis sensor kinase CheA